MKYVLIALGSLSLALGIIGIFLPLIPTTPLLLLSAWLYMRSSPRLYDWLIHNPVCGKYIRNFRENRAVPLHAKIVSVTLIWLSMGYCALYVVEEWWWAQLLFLILASAISWHILSFKTLHKK